MRTMLDTIWLCLTSCLRRSSMIAAASVIALLAGVEIELTANEWTGATGAFEDESNWAGAVPTAFDEAVIDNKGVAQLTTSLDVASLRIATQEASSGRIEIGPGGELFAQGAFIGENGTGSIEVNGGVMQIGNDSIHVGWRPNGSGEMTIKDADAIVVSGDDLQLGREGNGVLNFEAGRLQAGYTVIGKFGEGTWNQSGGLFAQAFGDVEIGDGGTDAQANLAGVRRGTMNLSGGIMHVAGDFAIGNRRGGGEVNISGGMVAVSGKENGHIYIGRGADSTPNVGQDVTLRVTGGEATIFANGGLLMNPNEVAESSTLVANLTGAEHSTIYVAGNADVVNGTLRVELDGFRPQVGDSWLLVQTATELEAFTDLVDAEIDALGYDPVNHRFAAEEGEVIGPFAEVDTSAASDFEWDVEYTGESIVLTVVGGGGLLGDFDRNGFLDADDINQLAIEIENATNPPNFDVNQDGLVDPSDLSAWLSEKNTWVGDVNLDGEFNSTDLVSLFSAGKYETGVAAFWTEGDFDADGIFTTSDLTVAFADGGYERGPRPNVPPVPEPTNMAWFAMALLPWLRNHRSIQ